MEAVQEMHTSACMARSMLLAPTASDMWTEAERAFIKHEPWLYRCLLLVHKVCTAVARVHECLFYFIVQLLPASTRRPEF